MFNPVRIMFNILIWVYLFKFAFGLSQITNFTMTCNENGMQVKIEFDSPFNGIIYSKNYFKDENCRFKSKPNQQKIEFIIKKKSCGLIESILLPKRQNLYEYRNTIIIQNHPIYQYLFDSAKSMICTWFSNYRTSVTREPINVGSLQEEEYIRDVVAKNSVEVLIDVRKGEKDNIFKQTSSGIMKIGEKLSVSIFLIDKNRQFDVKASNCYLYDTNDFESSRNIYLTDQDGCSTDYTLFDGFKKIKNVQKQNYVIDMLRKSEDNKKIIKSNVILTGNFNLIKFPEITKIYVMCNVEICKSECDSKCHPPLKIDISTDKIARKSENYSQFVTINKPIILSTLFSTKMATQSDMTTESIDQLNIETTTRFEKIILNKTSGDISNIKMNESNINFSDPELKTALPINEPHEYSNIKNLLHSNDSLDKLENLLGQEKINFNYQGLRIQEKEKKRSLSREKKIYRSIRKNRNSRNLENIIIERPDQSSAKVIFDFSNKLKGLPKTCSGSRQGRFVQEGSNQKELDFQVPANGCGSERVFSEKSSEIIENVIIIQNDPVFQEDGDIARLVACRHSFNSIPDLMSRRVIFKPFLVDNLNVISVPMKDDDGNRSVDVWIDITAGVFPDTEPLEGPVKIGDNLTLSIYVKDSSNNTDIRVKDCYAYDNIKSAKNNIRPSQLRLSEENGCPLRENLMSIWRRTINTMQTGATMIAFSTLKAFKFSEKDSVFLACNIDLCRENCIERCEIEPMNPDEEPLNDEINSSNQQSLDPGLGNDYEDPNDVNSLSMQGFRKSIARDKKTNYQQQPQSLGSKNVLQSKKIPLENQRPFTNKPGQLRPVNIQQVPQQGNRNQPLSQKPQFSQQPPRQFQRNAPQRPKQLPELRKQIEKPRQQLEQGQNELQTQLHSDFNFRVQQRQDQSKSQFPPSNHKSNLQSIIDQSLNNESSSVMIEQMTHLSKGSIAKSRSRGGRGKKSGLIERSRKSEFLGPAQKFSPRQPLSQSNFQQANNAPSLVGPNQQQQNLNSLPIPVSQSITDSNNILRQPPSTFQLDDLELSPSQQANHLYARKVVKKRAKVSSFLDKNSLPLAAPDSLMADSSESIQTRHIFYNPKYIPALSVRNNFGARLSY